MEIIGKALAGISGFAVLLLLSASLSAWPLMLALGVVHSGIAPTVPALGFWEVLVLVWALGSLMAIFRGQKGAYTEKRRS